MFSNMALWIKLILAAGVAFLLCFGMTPPVKRFAELIGAVDKPSERRINKVPIPRMGGLAIFLGFVLTALLFVPLSTQVTGKTFPEIEREFDGLGYGAFKPAVGEAVVETLIEIGWLSVPLTVLWIVACTNAVNLIDGLDGLAVGVSAISSLTMLVVSLIVSDPAVSLLLAALTGACLGFMPYNLNPAKIFMGDVGSQLLGFVLSTVSILGLFKMHAIITFVVPFLALALPLADTTFAFFRRILRGQSPFHPDRGHLHHRLLDMGLSQKQAVALMYGISALLGIAAVLMTWTNPVLRIGCAVLAFGISITVWLFVFRKNPNLHVNHRESNEKKEQQ